VKALALMREGVSRYPSWRNLYRAAQMEYRQGRFAEARSGLDRLLQVYPGNYDGLTMLGEVELLHGSTRRAVEIYTALVKRYPRPGELNNLGVAQMYLANYGEAEKSFRWFARLEPSHPINLLNLADALYLQGRTQEAAAAYRRVLAGQR
jgi:tetratricopeptide (TPR) repeat protein